MRMHVCVGVYIYMLTCKDEYMYLQTDALSKLGKEYSQNKFLTMKWEEVLKEYSHLWEYGPNWYYFEQGTK